MLINAYCNEDVIVLKYRYLALEGYDILSKRLKRHKYFVKTSSTDEGRMDLYFFHIPLKLKGELKKFLHSEFNKFTKKYIEKIIKFQDIQEKSAIYKILHDDHTLRKAMSINLRCKIPDNIPLQSKIEECEIWKGD